MSEDEVERFEITDYDLDNEFNINRPRFRQSKNQQIYGVWADDSDEEEAPSTSSKRQSFHAKKKQSYTTPVSFIAGGIQQSGKKKEGVKEETKDGDEMDDSEQVAANSSSEEEDLPKAGFGKRAAFASKGKQGKRAGFGGGSSFSEIDAEIAGMRRKGMNDLASKSLMQKGVGNWERHTKGIGAKLLLKMGYQPGKGLGRDLQGISAPVEAAVRKGRGAIGAYGPEVGQRIAGRKQNEKIDSEDEESKEYSEQLSKWRKGGEGAAKKKTNVNYVYKSVEQVIEEGKNKAGRTIKDFNNLSKVKVIDMTGPEQRILSGYHAIAGQQRPSEEWDGKKEKVFRTFNLPELLHNLDLLVNMSEQDIQDGERTIRSNKDRKVVIDQEIERLDHVIENQAKQINNFESVLSLIDKLKEKPLSLNKAAYCVKELKEKHNTEYEIYEIGVMASNLVTPLLKDALKSWDPLNSPTSFISEFQRWQLILETEKSHTLSSAAAVDPYHTLVWGAWTPSVRTAAINWNCRESASMIALISAWKGIIPRWILNSIGEQIVLPRLEEEVEKWNPLTDMIPVHQWIHPWIPFLKDRLSTSVYPTIRRKLSAALTAWHPSDKSALLMLKPWKQAFPPGDLHAFLVTNILPKLQTSMQELVINPHQQHLDQWNWVMEWEELMPGYTMASLLEKLFFPKWLQVLTMWLTHNPNFDEISNWYRGWKGMIPAQLRNQPTVKAKLNEALQLMNRAAMAASQNQSLAFLAAQPPPPPPPTHRDPQELMAEAVRTATQIPQGFRELLQKKCEERGILFMPIPNRYHEAKQIYRCGKIQVYLDRSVLFICRNGSIWTPSNLQSALDAAL